MRLDPKIVADWIALQHVGLNAPETDSLWPAWEAVYEMGEHNPEMLWEFIREVLKADASDKIAMNLSAGPLEDLLAQHGEAFIDRIEVEAKLNPSFASLLGGVWQSDMPEHIWKRVISVWDRRGWDGVPAA